MSNSRRLRRQMTAGKRATADRAVANAGKQFPGRPPSLSSVRRWLKQAEADGDAEHTVDTSKPGHPHMWRLTEAGKAKPAPWADTREMLTELQARRVAALMKHGVSESRAITAVTRGWTGPRPEPR